MPTPSPFGQVFGQGVKYIKINRYDSGGLDRSGYLGQLTNLTINYDDLGPIQYNIVTTQEQDTYFVYGIQTRNQNTSSVNYEVLDYTFSSSADLPAVYEISQSRFNGYDYIKEYEEVWNDPLSNFNSSSGIFNPTQTPNVVLNLEIKGTITNNNAQSKDVRFYIGNVSGSEIINITKTCNGSSSTIYEIYFENINQYLIENIPVCFGVYTLDSTPTPLDLNSFTLTLTQTGSLNPSTSSLVIFNPEFIDWDYNDYNALFGNADIPQFSNTFMDVDYTSNFTTPVNFDLITSGTADRASVQDSNYNSKTWSNIRYNGSRQSSYDFNKPFTK